MENFVSIILSKYKDFIRKTLRPKALPVAPNLQLVQEDATKGRMAPRIHLDRISDHL